MPDENEVRSVIRNFLANRVKKIAGVGDDLNLVQAGLINSMFAMQLVLFWEKTWSISVPDQEIQIDNFSSIDNLTAFVVKKLAA